jgi:nucleoside-diphosphate-sugar epimerase
MAAFTVFGAEGWIGRALVRHLAARGHEARSATRNSWPASDENLANVIFAIGMTADFRGHPMQTAEAHVGRLLEVIKRYRYESFLYLSSARVYRDVRETSENLSLVVNPNSPDDVYSITKLAAESVCLSLNEPRIRIVRLSNVIGTMDRSDNFLSTVVREARTKGNVTIQQSPESAKDYVGLDEIVSLMEMLILHGNERLYNLASGSNVTHRRIAELITQTLGARVSFAEKGPTVIFPQISIERVRSEFGFSPPPFETLFMRVANQD